MEKFKGTDHLAVTICNKLLDIIEQYRISGTKSEGVLYLGAKEMWAISTIDPHDHSIDRNIKTGEVKLYGIPVIRVAKKSYAALCPSIILDLGE